MSLTRMTGMPGRPRHSSARPSLGGNKEQGWRMDEAKPDGRGYTRRHVHPTSGFRTEREDCRRGWVEIAHLNDLGHPSRGAATHIMSPARQSGSR